MSRRQGVFWLLTVPENDFNPTTLHTDLSWCKGQLEEGSETGYRHWQIICAFKSKKSLSSVKKIFGDKCHGELSRSEAANDYVHKEETACPGTRFELGSKPIRRNSKVDWESVWTAAQSGNIISIPAHVRITSYRTIRAISSDYSRPIPMERECKVFWGKSGTGKSRRAWGEAGMEAYCKDPRSKFWDGYQVEENVVIDEFRGGIDISHLLRWLDRYPVRVEIKGSSRPLLAKRIWITSNVRPEQWYPDLDADTLEALMRRLEVTEFT